MGCIYLIQNTVNGKCYIGQTIRDAVKGRIRDHLNSTNNGSQLVKRAIAKYGKDAFTYEILHDGIIPEFLDILEIEAIQKHNTLAPNGYNLDGGGHKNKVISDETRLKLSIATKGENHPMYGKKHSAETRQKMSNAHTGKQAGEKHPNYGKALSAETRRKLSIATKGKNNPNYGKTHSKETRRKISESNKGRRGTFTGKKHSAEARQKMSEYRKDKKASAETRRKMSESHKGKQAGEKHPNFGKKASTKTRQKLRIAKQKNPAFRPEYYEARQFYFSVLLPSNVSAREMNKQLYEKFPNVPKGTIRAWTCKWNSES